MVRGTADLWIFREGRAVPGSGSDDLARAGCVDTRLDGCPFGEVRGDLLVDSGVEVDGVDADASVALGPVAAEDDACAVAVGDAFGPVGAGDVVGVVGGECGDVLERVSCGDLVGGEDEDAATVEGGVVEAVCGVSVDGLPR